MDPILQDMDGDGDIDCDDLAAMGITPGSAKAKKLWLGIETEARETGEYQGHPLRPGAHPGDGDFDLLVDRLVWHDGHDPEVAQRIAAKVNRNLNGG